MSAIDTFLDDLGAELKGLAASMALPYVVKGDEPDQYRYDMSRVTHELQRTMLEGVGHIDQNRLESNTLVKIVALASLSYAVLVLNAAKGDNDEA